VRKGNLSLITFVAFVAFVAFRAGRTAVLFRFVGRLAFASAAPSAFGPIVIIFFLFAREQDVGHQFHDRRQLGDALHHLPNLGHRAHNPVNAAHAVDEPFDITNIEGELTLAGDGCDGCDGGYGWINKGDHGSRFGQVNGCGCRLRNQRFLQSRPIIWIAHAGVWRDVM